ncbi:pyruvate dehydrogenase E2 component (dihydrolipoamide acetyltransferase) [Paraburkholderia silvatlantica]|uniref:Acetyltransferase component of pyruvate dehydrogenase complex n=2 Tax=Paraburkholderia silvatlantica TaxID=321895 RepID=A0ABR6FNI5_9BURK|nr:pyruvate dehydrogenase E2 component (dihydrolipoamide acetyltransferase) [Paraburkholderia silvatlantica]
MTRIEVPDIGDYKNIPVIEVMVEVGQRVEQEQSLVMLESDKATMDVPSPTAGVIKELKVAVGDTVSEGALIALIESDGERHDEAVPVPAAAAAAHDLPRPEADVTTVPTQVPAPTPEPNSAPAPLHRAPAREGEPRRESHASPSVRKFARELGVEISRVHGTGPKQRVTSEDVTAFVRNAMATSSGTPTVSTPPVAANGAELGLLPWPKVDFAKFGPVDSQPLSRIKKISGANLHRNWVMIPHVTNNDEADITELEALRVQLNKEHEKAGLKFTMLAFLIKAVVAALKKFPTFNASLDGDNLVFKQYYHIGFAADTPNGLVVPVIRDADKKGLVDIAKEIAELSKAARDGKLKPDQMQGGCFSISSLGGVGGTHFTPLINAPEVAILGVSRSAMKPVWDGKQFVPRLILPLSLSFDHRAVDGAEAARFNAYLGAVLGDFRRIVL